MAINGNQHTRIKCQFSRAYIIFNVEYAIFSKKNEKM